jgi:quercetin dioxygenase-like cupin family protein/DNA-binding XRE family transcriptional regulator
MMSQIETGKTRPSVSTLYTITLTLGLSFDHVFDMSDVDNPADSRATTLIRRGTLHNGGRNNVLEALGLARDPRQAPPAPPHPRRMPESGGGVTLEPLGEMPALHVGVFQATFAPGAESCGLADVMRHPGWEYGFLVSGGLMLTLHGENLRIGAGDAVSFEGTAPHRYFNDTPEPAVGVWFVIEQTEG